MIIGTKVEFENLADYILRDYLGSEYESYKPFDVNAFAKDYLKLEISYCEFNPKDNIEGKRIGNQIQLDQRLNEPTRIGERNFTVAHEGGHDLINWQDPNYVPDQTINYRIRSQRKELKTENDFREWQANVVASCLLLRPCLVDWTMFTFARKEKITVFGGYTIHRMVLFTYLQEKRQTSLPKDAFSGYVLTVVCQLTTMNSSPLTSSSNNITGSSLESIPTGICAIFSRTKVFRECHSKTVMNSTI